MQTYNLYDKDFRQRLIANPKLVLQEISSKIEINVVENTRNITYIVMPSNNFTQGDLDSVQAAATNCASTVGTAGSASTLGSVCTTLGSATTIGSVGSGGSA